MRKISRGYRDLEPYIIDAVRSIVGRSGNGGGTMLASVPLHGLADLTKHSGALAVSQAPWAVQLSNYSLHVGDANAHHNQSHVLATAGALGPDHTVSGLTAGQVLRATGPTAAGFAQPQHSDLGGVTADQHHAQQHAITGSDHTVTGSLYQIVGLTALNTLGLLTPSASPGANTIVRTDASSQVTLSLLDVNGTLYMDGILDFGTNTVYEDATYLRFTGSKPILLAQAIQASGWSIATNGQASFSGSVQVVGGGDLTVGSNVLFVDVSQNNVGIACAPDSQFALDCAGPARAQYFIGPHALAVKDAIMICHYDGVGPYNNNYYGTPVGHMGQVATATNVMYRAGKFSKAIQVARNAVNSFLDPSFEYDASLSQWNKHSSAGTLTATRSTEVQPLYGDYVAKVVQSAVSTGILYQAITSQANVVMSVFVRKADRSAVTSADCSLVLDVDVTTTYQDMGDGWYRLRYSTTTGPTTAVWCGLRVQTNKTLYVDGFQIELGRTGHSPFMDGTMPNVSWTGTPYLSSSSRPGSLLQYTLPTIKFDTPLTIMGWYNLDYGAHLTNRYLWSVTSDAYSVYLSSSGAIWTNGVNLGTTWPGGWAHVALTTNGYGSTTIYLNGVSIGTQSISRGDLIDFYVGCQGLNVSPISGLVDDFAIINRMLPDKEVRAIYESNAPIFAETSTIGWVATPRALVWADNEGLWMRDTSGYEVFGLYGNDATTKSWGNFTLSAGDLVLGQNRASKSAIRWTQATGKFGFYGNGSGTVQVEIATDGSLQAGAGKVVLNSNGVSLTQSASNSSSVLSSTDGSRVKWNTLEMFNAAYDTWVDPVYSYTWYRYTGVIREATSGANDNSRLYLTAAYNPGAGYAGPELIMDVGSVIETYTYNFLDYGNGTFTEVMKLKSKMIHANTPFVIVEHTNGGQVRVIQSNATGAKPALRLSQSDLSEELIRFDATVAAGNPVNTTALGTYYGRVRVSVNGTFYWMPLYN